MKIVFDIRGDNDMFDITFSGYSESKSLGVEFLRIGYDVSENFVKLEKYCGDRILKVYPGITIFEDDVIRYALDIVKYHERRKNEIYDLFMKDNDYRKYRDDNVKLDEEIAKSCRKDVFNHVIIFSISIANIHYNLHLHSFFTGSQIIYTKISFQIICSIFINCHFAIRNQTNQFVLKNVSIWIL